MPIDLEELTKGTSIRPDELRAGTEAFNARRESFQRAARFAQVEKLDPRLRDAATATREPKRTTAAATRKVEHAKLDHNARKRGDRTSMER